MLSEKSIIWQNEISFLILTKKHMTHAEKYIIETYSGFFDSLSSLGKIELLEKLAKSLKRNNKVKEKKNQIFWGICF